MADSAKERLVDFLEKKAFAPVLQADPDSYPEDKRDTLKDVQEATRSESERFHSYDSAEKIYEMYKDDLSSEPAQKIDRELRDLDLPRLKDFENEFERLAEDVGARH